MRQEGDNLTVLFDEVGYKTLDVMVLQEKICCKVWSRLLSQKTGRQQTGNRKQGDKMADRMLFVPTTLSPAC